MSVKVILDPGSTHDGELHKARRLVEIAADVGAGACKFQLLSNAELVKQSGAETGNISIGWEWMPELIELGKQKGVEVFASVFDRSGWDYVIACGCKSVKLSYGQAQKLHVYPHEAVFENIYISQDVMSRELFWKPVSRGIAKPIAGRLIRLYCVSEYPVKSVLDFEALFDGPSPRFDGFSSHCLGVSQEIAAVQAGAKYLEFHFMGDWSSPTPDGKFAKTPAMTERLCKRVKG